MPTLPKLLALISTNHKDQPANHFYANVVKSKELIPLYTEVIIWLLKHDLLVSLHLYVRIFVPLAMKEKLSQRRLAHVPEEGKRMAIYKRYNILTGEPDDSLEGVSVSFSGQNWVSMSPKTARKQTQQLSRPPSEHSSEHSQIQDQNIPEEGFGNVDIDDEDELPDPEMALFNAFDASNGDLRPRFIFEPSRATGLESVWLEEMSEGKDPQIVKLFQKYAVPTTTAQEHQLT